LAKEDDEKAFEYAEKAHAVLLWQSLSQQAAQSLLPDDDKEKIKNLIRKIRQANQPNQNGNIDISTLNKLERELKNLENALEKEHSAYRQRHSIENH